MLAFGIISEVYAEKGLARVRFPDYDNVVSNPLPMSMPRTYQDKFSIPFDVNEHVWCIMDKEFENGVIGGAIYSINELPAEGSVAENVHIAFVHGLYIDYSRTDGTLTIGGSGKVKVDIDGEVEITAAKVDITAPLVEMSGNLVVKGSFTAGAIGTTIANGGTGKISVAGDIETTSGDVKAGNISLKTHKHLGVQTGGGTSGTPTP